MRFLIVILLFIGASNVLIGQKLKVLRFDQLEQLIEKPTDSLLIFNFFATWCKPCMQEIPDFLKLQKEVSNKPIQFYFISLDMEKDSNKIFANFIEKYQTRDFTYLLKVPKGDWISKIDQNWQGNIPATLVINHKKKMRKFIAKSLDYQSLTKLIK